MSESYITCPYCGHVHVDSWEMGPDSNEWDTTIECHSCEREFLCSMTTTVRYTSEELEA